jgi:hypothetical protein
MAQKSTSLFHQPTWNIVELETRRKLRQTINILIQQANDPTTTTSEMRQDLLRHATRFGTSLTFQLVRALNRDDQQERQSITWLLILLNDSEAIVPLQQMSQNKSLPRAIRLSASLTLAGMGVTPEVLAQHQQRRLYAIS